MITELCGFYKSQTEISHHNQQFSMYYTYQIYQLFMYFYKEVVQQKQWLSFHLEHMDDVILHHKQYPKGEHQAE